MDYAKIAAVAVILLVTPAKAELRAQTGAQLQDMSETARTGYIMGAMDALYSGQQSSIPQERRSAISRCMAQGAFTVGTVVTLTSRHLMRYPELLRLPAFYAVHASILDACNIPR